MRAPGASFFRQNREQHKVQAFERYFLAANRWALILLLAAMSVIIFTNVVLRYGGHIAVENLQDALPRSAAVAVRIVVAGLLFAFFGFMVWYGWLYMERTMFQLTAVTQIPFAYIYSAMLFGGILLIVHWLLVVRGYVLRREFASDAHFDANASASL